MNKNNIIKIVVIICIIILIFAVSASTKREVMEHQDNFNEMYKKYKQMYDLKKSHEDDDN